MTDFSLLDSTVTDATGPVDRFVGMFYGDMGTGKTVFAVALAQRITPPDKKIIFIDTSDGWVSLKNHTNLTNRVERVRYEGLKGITLLAEAIRTGYGRFANVGAVIWDELSSSANDVLQNVALTREAKFGQNAGLLEGQNDQSDYLLASNLTIRPLRSLIQLPGIHVITVAHERADGGDAAIKQIGPDFWRDLRGKATKPQQLVARFTGKTQGANYVREIQVHPTSTINCKTRIGGLDVKNKPTDVANKIQSWLKEGSTDADQNYQIKSDEEN